MRIVSLACSNTEIVCALGCSDLLVGVDDHSDYPEDVVSRLPRLGPDLDVDVEAVVKLEPDLVLATLTVPGHERVVERLGAAGLPFIAPEPVSLDDVYRDIGDIAERLGVAERGEALLEEMRADLSTEGPGTGASGSQGSPDEAGPRRASLLIQWWPKPSIVPGRLSWATDVIRAAGGTNPLGDEDVKSRPVPDEEVARIDPDAIVISWCGVEPAKYRPEVVLNKEAWAGLGAVRAGHVFCVPEALLGRPGPRLVDGVRALRAVVKQIQRHNAETPTTGEVRVRRG